MTWLLSPLAWLLLAGLLALLAWRMRATWLAFSAATLAVAAVTATTPLVANLLVARLERPATQSVQCLDMPPATVVVLGGGVDRLPVSRADFEVLNLASRRRTERGVQYWRDRDGHEVVLVGGPVAPGSVATAELMDEYARWLGLPAAAIRIERQSRNTRENASRVAALVPPLPRRIALATSAMHMPRARLAFSAAGFDVCALPTDFQTIAVGAPGYLLPRSRALMRTEAALHEIVGIGLYRWQEWRSVGGGRAATAVR